MGRKHINILVMKNIYIIGASSFGREIESLMALIPEEKRDWIIKGYLDNAIDKEEFRKYPSDLSLLGSDDEYEFGENDYCIVGVALPSIRKKIFDKLKDKVKFYTFIFPNVIVGKFTSIGEGSVIFPNCTVSTNVIIGTGVVLNAGTQIGHDVSIGNYTSVMANVDVAGCCTLGECAFIGSNAVIIPSIKVGDNSKIGAGSVVIKRVNEGDSVFGSPATKIN